MTCKYRHRILMRQRSPWAVLVALVFLLVLAAPAQTFTVLYQFPGGAAGAMPYRGSLFVNNKNVIYGSTAAGGDTACDPPYGCGVAFKISPTLKETVLHTFSGSPDGAEPYLTTTVNAAGIRYGVAEYGGTGPCTSMGPSGCGAIIKISPNGKETVLYSFGGAPDGATPEPGLVLDAAGNIYGTTEVGGAFNSGTVFKISPRGKETILHSFGSSTDGQLPFGGVIRDSAGHLYGTTWFGGTYSSGIVFKLNSSGKETILHSFGAGSDGNQPFAGLAQDAKGNLYGTTVSGGTDNLGTVFKINRATGQESVLYSFTGAPSDGSSPNAALVIDAKRNLYSTTFDGGLNGDGTIFKIDATGKETLLHSFAGSDGRLIYGGLVFDQAGNLYGTALIGGTANAGIVFEVTP
jgi:uncharacterized repeat protein (TIGR03803 family)